VLGHAGSAATVPVGSETETVTGTACQLPLARIPTPFYERDSNDPVARGRLGKFLNLPLRLRIGLVGRIAGGAIPPKSAATKLAVISHAIVFECDIDKFCTQILRETQVVFMFVND